MDFLDDLFERLENNNLRPGLTLPDGVLFKSDLTVAWEARIEAKNLKDPQLIQPLKARLDKEKTTKQRINIINVLVGLADNISEHSIADYILNVVKSEKVRWIKDVALGALNRNNLEISQEKELLFDLVQDKDWQIKLNALGLLKRLDKSYSSKIEDICLELIQLNKKKPHSLNSLCNVLSKHGSTKSLAAIKEIAKTNSKSFTVNSALIAVANICGEEELDFFIEIFQTNKNNDVKSIATQTLCQFGDEKVCDILLKRAKSILSKQRKSNIFYVAGFKPELVHIFEFLQKIDTPKSKKFFDFVHSNKLGFLDSTEKKWLEENI